MNIKADDPLPDLHEKALRGSISYSGEGENIIIVEGVPHLGAGSGEDVTRAGQDLTCKRSLYGKVCDDDAVALVLAPGVKQLPGEATLQHGRRGQHHAGAHSIQAALGLQLRDIFEVEWIGALRHSNCV